MFVGRRGRRERRKRGGNLINLLPLRRELFPGRIQPLNGGGHKGPHDLKDPVKVARIP